MTKRAKRRIIIDDEGDSPKEGDGGGLSPRSYPREEEEEEEEDDEEPEEVQYPTAWQTDRICNVSIVERRNVKSRTGRFIVKIQGKGLGKQREESFKWKTDGDMARAETEAREFRKEAAADLGLKKENEWRLIDEGTIEMKIRRANDEGEDYSVFFDSLLKSEVIENRFSKKPGKSRKWVLREKKTNGQRSREGEETVEDLGRVEEEKKMMICAHGRTKDGTGKRYPFYDEMSSCIMSPGNGEEVVHLDGNVFNNRRSNLRLKGTGCAGGDRDAERSSTQRYASGVRTRERSSDSESSKRPSYSDDDGSVPDDESNDPSSSDSAPIVTPKRKAFVLDDDADDGDDDDDFILIRRKRNTPDNSPKEKPTVRSSQSSQRIAPSSSPPPSPSPSRTSSKKKRKKTNWNTTDPNRWRISEKSASVVQIELRKKTESDNGKYALVDLNLVRKVKDYKWRYWESRGDDILKQRVTTTVSDRKPCEGHPNGKYSKTEDMHRLLRPAWAKIRHENGKALDNRLSNLRRI